MSCLISPHILLSYLTFQAAIGSLTTAIKLSTAKAGEMHSSSTLTSADSFAIVRRSLRNASSQARTTPIVCDAGFFGSPCKPCHCFNKGVCGASGCTDMLCAAGYISPPQCQTKCAPGTFGLNCRFLCHCQSSPTCIHINGQCDGACHVDWTGSGCQTRLPRLLSAPLVSNVTCSSVIVTWLAWRYQIDIGDSPLHGYTLQQNDTSQWRDIIDITQRGSQDQYSYTVTNIPEMTTLVFRVVANREEDDKKIIGRPGNQSEIVKIPNCEASLGTASVSVATTTKLSTMEAVAIPSPTTLTSGSSETATRTLRNTTLSQAEDVTVGTSGSSETATRSLRNATLSQAEGVTVGTKVRSMVIGGSTTSDISGHAPAVRGCQPNPCKNKGRCKENEDGFTCDCTATGYEGPRCEVDIDECKSSPCKHQALCTDWFKSFSCWCPDGYEGKLCDIKTQLADVLTLQESVESVKVEVKVFDGSDIQILSIAISSALLFFFILSSMCWIFGPVPEVFRSYRFYDSYSESDDDRNGSSKGTAGEGTTSSAYSSRVY